MRFSILFLSLLVLEIECASFSKYMGKSAHAKAQENEQRQKQISQKQVLGRKVIRNSAHQHDFEQLVMAMQRGHSEAVETFLIKNRKAQSYGDSRDGKTLPIIACMFSDNASLEVLIKFEAPIAAADDAGLTPLFVCSAQGNLKGVQMLLNNHVPVDGSPKKCTPLHETIIRFWQFNSLLHHQPLPGKISSQHAEVAELLIERGSDPAQECDGTFPISLAVQHRCMKCLKKMISARFVGVNAPGRGSELMDDQGTPLHAAASTSAALIGISKILVRHGNAGKIPPRGQERTDVPIHDAFRAWEIEIPLDARMIDDTMVNRTSMNEVLRRWHDSFVGELVAYGANVDITDANGNTPLHAAAYNGEIYIARRLVAHGAKKEIKNNVGETAADFARKQGRIDVLIFLLDVSLSGDYESDAELVGMPLDLFKIHCGFREPHKLRGIIQPVPDVKVTKLTDNTWGGEGRYDLDIDFCDIQQIDAAELPPKKFVSEFLNKQRPVIIRNALNKWPALTKWTPKELTRLYGSVKFPIFKNKNHGEVRESITMAMSEYINYMMNVDGEDQEPLFLVDYGLEKTAPAMLKDVREINYFSDYKNMISNYQFMISPLLGGASPHTHHSAANTLMHGKKRWFLYPPEKGFYSAKQMYNWYKEDYPTQRGGDSPIECVQQAGDLIYAPDGWGHATLYISDTVGIATLYLL